jgi:predicted flap endonuclease-1-like 5' DNA nuclease
MTPLFRLARSLFLFVLGVAASVLLGWWLMQWLRERETPKYAVRMPSRRPADVNIPLPPQPISEEAGESPEPARPDDLTQIDGIGPKYAASLHALGITTFAHLSRQAPDELAERLQAQGVRITGERIRGKDWIGQAARLAQV